MHGEEEDEDAVRDGIVIDAPTGGIVVRVDKNDEECGGCGSCAMKGLCHGRDAGHLDLFVPLSGLSDAPAPKKGARVRIAYRPANAALAALVMFVPPLCGLLAGGLAGWRLAGGDAVLVLGCGAGLAVGTVASVVLARVCPSLKPKTKFLRG